MLPTAAQKPSPLALFGTKAHEHARLKAAQPQPGYAFPPVSLMPGFIQVLPFSAVLQLLLTVNNGQLTLCPTCFAELTPIRSRSQNKHTPPKIKFKYPDYWTIFEIYSIAEYFYT